MIDNGRAKGKKIIERKKERGREKEREGWRHGSVCEYEQYVNLNNDNIRQHIIKCVENL